MICTRGRDIRTLWLYCLAVVLMVVSCTDLPAEWSPDTHTEVHCVVTHSASTADLWADHQEEQLLMQWDSTAWGALSYPPAETYHVVCYPHGSLTVANERNVVTGSTSIVLPHGTYDFLIYNNDTEQTPLRPSADGSMLNATTAPFTLRAFPDSLSLSSAPTLMPEHIYSVMSTEIDILSLPATDSLRLHTLNASPLPRTFIYIFQIRLLNNEATATRPAVNGCRAMVADGLAASCDIMSGINSTATTSHAFSGHQQTVQVPHIVPPIHGQPATYSLIGGRLVTFGLPGINATDPHHTVSLSTPCRLHVQLSYTNGSSRFVSFDISEALTEQPAGGLIPLTLDVSQYPAPATTSSDPFIISIDGWQHEVHTQVVG